MPPRASPYRDLVESRIYLHYLRTGYWADREALIENVERKFNPYHDEIGRFTGPPGVSVSHGNSPRRSASPHGDSHGRPQLPTTSSQIREINRSAATKPASHESGFRSSFVRDSVSPATSNADTYFELNKRQRHLGNLRSEAGPNPDPLIIADFDDLQNRLNANRRLLDERAKIADRHVLDLLRAGLAPVDIGGGIVNIARGKGEVRDYLAVAGAIPIGGSLAKLGMVGVVSKPAADASLKVVQFGGAFRHVRKLKGHHSHHMPANSASPIARGDGPSIAMSGRDHVKTASWGNKPGAKPHREAQAKLIREGEFSKAQ